MFDRLFDQITFLIRFIPESRQSVETIENQIASAKTRFDNALAVSRISQTIADIEKEVALANEVLETASRHTLMAAFLFLLIVPVAVVLMAVFGLNALVVDPINRLVEVMKKFQAGDFCIQAKVKNRDEIGILAAAFNTMAGEIKEKVDAMARLNKILKENE